MADGSGVRPGISTGDVRWLLAIVVIATSGVAGGLWAGQTSNPTTGVNFGGVMAGLFLGVALVCTGWIASIRPGPR